MPDGVFLRIYGVPNKTGLKFWIENTHLAAPAIFDVGNNESVYIQDVDFLKPDTFIKTATPVTYQMFIGYKARHK